MVFTEARIRKLKKKNSSLIPTTSQTGDPGPSLSLTVVRRSVATSYIGIIDLKTTMLWYSWGYLFTEDMDLYRCEINRLGSTELSASRLRPRKYYSGNDGRIGKGHRDQEQKVKGPPHYFTQYQLSMYL